MQVIAFPLTIGTAFSVIGLVMIISHFLNIGLIMDNLGIPFILVGLTLIGLARSVARPSVGHWRNVIVLVALAIVLVLANMLLAFFSINDFNIFFVVNAIIFSIITLFVRDSIPAERKALNWINAAILLSFICVVIIRVIET